MPPATHSSLGSPVSPLSLRPESLVPSKQHHYHPTTFPNHKNEEAPISPLSIRHPDSPTLGYFSAVSTVPSKPSLPAKYPRQNSSNTTAPSARRGQSAGAEARDAAQAVHLARAGTLHLQDHMPFQPASTKFASDIQVSAGDDADPSRPATLYLADHQPHRLAPQPRVPVLQPHSNNRPIDFNGRSGGAAEPDVEMQSFDKISASIVPDEDESEERTKLKRRKKVYYMIGWGFVVAMVSVIVIFAVLAIEVDKSGR